jgi:CheY-like chemotaxis protein
VRKRLREAKRTPTLDALAGDGATAPVEHGPCCLKQCGNCLGISVMPRTPAADASGAIELTAAAVLVIDDEEIVRKLIRKPLAAAGYTVLAASGSAEALSLSRAYAGDIALAAVDLVLNASNGLDVANEIAIDRPRTPILYISGLTKSIAAACIAGSVPQAFLAKPFTREQLLARVREHTKAR